MEISRGIDPVLLAEFSKPFFYPAVLVKLDWPSEEVRIHSGVGDLAFATETYKGLGKLGAISVAEEEIGYVPTDATLTLYSDYGEMLADLNADAEGRRCDIWVGATTKPGGTTLVGTPFDGFIGGVSSDSLIAPRYDAEGSMSEVPRLDVGIQAGTHARVSGNISHSDEDQQSRFPGDTLFARTARASAQRTAPPKW